MLDSCVLWLLLNWTPNKAESICRKMGENLRRPALHAFIKHCGTKSARMAPPNTMTDSYTRLLPKARTYLILMTRTSKSKPYFIKLPKYTVVIHWWVEYAILLLCWNTRCFVTLWSYTQHFYTAELYPIKSHSWLMPYLVILLGIPNFKTLLSYNLS